MRLGAAAHANDERCALKLMHPSLHYCLRIHEHVPPMPSCAQVPLPSAVLTSAGAFRSDRAARVSAVASGAGFAAPPYAAAFPSYRVYHTHRPCRTGKQRRVCGDALSPSRAATIQRRSARVEVLTGRSPRPRRSRCRHCRRLECRVLLCVTPDRYGFR